MSYSTCVPIRKDIDIIILSLLLISSINQPSSFVLSQELSFHPSSHANKQTSYILQDFQSINPSKRSPKCLPTTTLIPPPSSPTWILQLALLRTSSPPSPATPLTRFALPLPLPLDTSRHRTNERTGRSKRQQIPSRARIPKLPHHRPRRPFHCGPQHRRRRQRQPGPHFRVMEPNRRRSQGVLW